MPGDVGDRWIGLDIAPHRVVRALVSGLQAEIGRVALVRAMRRARGRFEERHLRVLARDVLHRWIARFLERHGEGLHHLCFDTPDIVKILTSLKEMHVELIDESPRPGLAGQIAFVHPRACGGVLVELATPASGAAEPAAPVRLKRLVIGASDVLRSGSYSKTLTFTVSTTAP